MYAARKNEISTPAHHSQLDRCAVRYDRAYNSVAELVQCKFSSNEKEWGGTHRHLKLSDP
jgi:hypothetical protein